MAWAAPTTTNMYPTTPPPNYKTSQEPPRAGEDKGSLSKLIFKELALAWRKALSFSASPLPADRGLQFAERGRRMRGSVRWEEEVEDSHDWAVLVCSFASLLTSQSDVQNSNFNVLMTRTDYIVRT